MANTNIKKLEKAYDSYKTQVKLWGLKGYSVTILSESEFRTEYERQKKIAIKLGDPKRSVIRKMAADSREFNKSQMIQARQILGASPKEFKQKVRNMDRNDFWDLLMVANASDYDISKAQYNGVF